VRRLAKNGHTTVSVARHLATRHGVLISRMTVGRVLKGGRRPLMYLPVIRGRRLSDVNQQKRMVFHQLLKGRGWQRIIFIHCKFLYMYKDQAKGWLFKWKDPSNREVLPQHPNTFVFHFYAAVCKGFKFSLVLVPLTRGEEVGDRLDKISLKWQHFLVAGEQLQQHFEGGCSRGPCYRVFHIL